MCKTIRLSISNFSFQKNSGVLKLCAMNTMLIFKEKSPIVVFVNTNIPAEKVKLVDESLKRQSDGAKSCSEQNG